MQRSLILWISYMFFGIFLTHPLFAVQGGEGAIDPEILRTRSPKLVGYLDKSGQLKNTGLCEPVIPNIAPLLGSTDQPCFLQAAHFEEVSKNLVASRALIPIHYFPSLIQNKPIVVIEKLEPFYPLDSDITLDASHSYSPDGSALQYKWEIWEPQQTIKQRNPVFRPENLDSLKPTVTFNATREGLYLVRVTVGNNTNKALKSFQIAVGGQPITRAFVNGLKVLDTEIGLHPANDTLYAATQSRDEKPRISVALGWKRQDGRIFGQDYSWRPRSNEVVFRYYAIPRFAQLPVFAPTPYAADVTLNNPDWGHYGLIVDTILPGGIYLAQDFDLEIMGNPLPQRPGPIDLSIPDERSWGLSAVRADEAWKLSQGARDIKVAVIDSGINYLDPDLAPSLSWRPDAPDFVGMDLVDNSVRPFDNNGHGSHCAGIIAAAKGNGGVIGISHQTSILPYKAIDAAGGGTTLDIVKAIYQATNDGAHIISASWGFNAVGIPQDEVDLLKQAVNYTEKHGVLFVVAAGNDRTDLSGSVEPHMPVPAMFGNSNILAVAATDIHDRLASFSNFGRLVHVAAPGEDILSSTQWNTLGDRTIVLSGTSMATPLVAGVAALVKSVDPKASPARVKELLITTSRQIPSLQNRIQSGGIVDAAAALQAAKP